MPTQGQVGIKEESTYGTPVTVDRFFDFVREGIKHDVARIESNSLRAGTRVLKSTHWAAGAKKIGGTLEMELATKGQGLWWKHALGAVATSQPDAGGNPTVYDHSFTPGDLFDKMLTVQVGRERENLTVHPFTYHGVKIQDWELKCAVNELAKLTLTVVGEDEDTSTALASASYPSGLTFFPFTQGTLTIGGTATKVRDASLKGANNLSADRWYLGSALMRQPIEQSLRVYTGNVAADFEDTTAYNRFVNGTEAALVLKFEGATITGIYKFTVQITANVRFDGETPTIGGREVIKQPLPFKAIASSTDASALTVLYRTTDTTP